MKQEKIRSLQLLRGLAFLGICLGHFGDRVIIPSNFAGWGVTVFFVMSGFLNMIHGYSDETHNGVIDIRYSIKKIRKLYPLLFVTTIIAFLLESYHYKDSIFSDIVSFVKISTIRLATNLLLISNWFPKIDSFKEYNIVVWFFSTMFLFYIFTPFFIRIIRSRTKSQKKTIIINMVVIYIVSVLLSILFWDSFVGDENAWWFVYENPLIRVWEYLSGMLLATLYFKSREGTLECSEIGHRYFFILILSFFLTVVLWMVDILRILPSGLLTSSNGFFYTIPTLALVYSLSILDKNLGKLIDFPIIYPIKRVGDLSLYAYLIHVPIISIIHALLIRLNICYAWLWGTVSLILIIACSMSLEWLKTKKN